MKEHGILFTGEMVRAILAGRKTATRRLVTPRTSEIGSLPISAWGDLDFNAPDPRLRVDNGSRQNFFCTIERCQYLHVPHRNGETVHRVYPRIEPGYRLWVRETWGPSYVEDLTQERPRTLGGTWGSPARPDLQPCVVYRADGDMPAAPAGQGTARWCPSIHMPRWASRITLEVTDVRVERVQDISEEDIVAEGCTVDAVARMTGVPWSDMPTLHDAWREAWDFVADGDARWATNPWVWVVSFRRLE